MKVFLLLLVSFIPLVLFSQTLQGVYRENNDFISFRNDSVSFKIDGEGGLIGTFKGEGNYEILDQFLLFHTTDFHGEKTVVTASVTKNDAFEFLILDKQGKPIPNVNISFLDAAGNALAGTFTNENGLADYTRTSLVKKIHIGLVGYDNIEIECGQNNHFKLELATDEIIEHQTIAFQIINNEIGILSLQLLTIDFKSLKNHIKDLHKLERKANKCGNRTRRFVL